MNRSLCRVGRSVVTAAALAGILASALVAPPAVADPPPNDSITSATRISSIPARFEQDLAEATDERDDGRCVSEHSVWFRYRSPATLRAARVTTLGSAVDTDLAVFRGPRGARTLVACNDRVGTLGALAVDLVKGGRYWIALSTGQRRLAHGPAVLNLYPKTDPGLEVTVDTVAAGDVSGRLLIGGAATCTLPSYLELSVQVHQESGGDEARAWAHRDGILCGPDAPAQWGMSLDSETVKAFLPGQAVVSMRAEAKAGVGDGARWRLPETVLDVTSGPL